jgi:WD40 repeat protein
MKTETAAPTATNAAGSIFPGLDGSSMPMPKYAIGLENAGLVRELARWGKGIFLDAVFSPDGRYLAASSSIGIYSYDADTFSLIKMIRTPSEVDSIAFSPDGKTLAYGLYNGPIVFFDLLTMKESRVPEGESIYVKAFSPDGKPLAIGSVSDLRILDLSTGEVRSLLPDCRECDVAFLSDGRTIAVAADFLELVDSQTGEVVRSLSDYSGWWRSVDVSPDGKILASGSDDNSLALWDIATGWKLSSLQGSGDSSNLVVVDFSPDGSLLASGSTDSVIKLWNISPGEILRELNSYEGDVCSVAFSTDGKKLASIKYFNPGFELWDVETGQKIEYSQDRLDSFSRYYYRIAISPVAKVLAVGGKGRVGLWDIATGRELRTMIESTGFVAEVAFSPDGKSLAAGSKNGTIGLWDAATGWELRKLRGHSDYISDIVFSPNGMILASGSSDDEIRIWDAATGVEKRMLTTMMPPVDRMAFSSDGTMPAAASYTAINIFDTATWERLRAWRGSTGSIFDITFSPDGELLASAADGTPITLWNPATGEERCTLNSGIAVAFSPDGKIPATGSWDGTIKLWDAAARRLLCSLEGTTGVINDLIFSSDGSL